MSRSALLVSLALHAGVLALVGWSHSTATGHAGLGSSEIGVAFFPGDAGGLVEADEAAAEPPAATLTTPTYQPSVTPPRVIEVQPAPVAVTEITPPPLTTTATMPQSLLPVSSEKKTRSKSRSTAASGGMPTVSNGSSAGTGGGGATGAGTGGGGNGYIPPRFLMRYKPLYPEQARTMRLEGIVLLLVSVDVSGHVTSARLSQSCGHQILDRAALDAVRSWRFIPARQANQPISATVEVPIRFHFSV